MSDTKLVVLQKKIVQLLRTSLPKHIKPGKDGKPFRSRTSLHKPQRPKLRKVHYSTNKNSFKGTENSVKKVFLPVFRHLKASIKTNFFLKAKATSFWRALLPQILENEKKLETVWINAGNEMTISTTSKVEGSSGSADSFQQALAENPEPKDDTKNIESGSKNPTEVKLNADEDSNEKKLLTLKRPREAPEEMPPPQRCRLSCPLPPLEYCPPEKNEFLSSYQSPNVKFSALQMEFLPQQEEKETKSQNYTMRESGPSLERKKELLASSSFPVTFHQSIPTQVKKEKNSLDLVGQGMKPGDENPKMKALLFEPTSLKLNFDDVNAPTKIFKDEVLVQVIYSGVCGTDLFITEGKVSCGNNPVILGHEISGKVYATGSDVTHVQFGDDIAVNAYTACCICRYCSRGLFSACSNEGLNNSIGISKNGGWAEFVVVKKSQVYKIPEELNLNQAALIQPLSCVLSALSKITVSHEMNILLQGLGLSGCLWASVLHSRGYKNVLVTDKSERKRNQFETLNTNYTFVPPEDVGKHAVDIVVECTGSPVAIEKSFNVLNPSGQMCFFGKPSPMAEVRCIPYEIIQKEITIVGNSGNSSHFSEAINVATTMGHRYLDFEKLGIQTFSLEDFQEAFRLKKLGEFNKIIFNFET